MSQFRGMGGGGRHRCGEERKWAFFFPNLKACNEWDGAHEWLGCQWCKLGLLLVGDLHHIHFDVVHLLGRINLIHAKLSVCFMSVSSGIFF